MSQATQPADSCTGHKILQRLYGITGDCRDEAFSGRLLPPEPAAFRAAIEIEFLCISV